MGAFLCRCMMASIIVLSFLVNFTVLEVNGWMMGRPLEVFGGNWPHGSWVMGRVSC